MLMGSMRDAIHRLGDSHFCYGVVVRGTLSTAARHTA